MVVPEGRLSSRDLREATWLFHLCVFIDKLAGLDTMMVSLAIVVTLVMFGLQTEQLALPTL